MKPLLVLGKIFLIGCFWSLFFIEGIRVVLLINWHFDIFWPPHWVYLWSLWHSGWVIDHAKEWAFILILLASVPMWLTGWIFLSVISWHKLFDFIIMTPMRKLKIYLNDKKAPMLNDLAVKKAVKKRSYKEIRPNLQISPAAEDPYDNHPIASAISPIEISSSSYTSTNPYSSASATKTSSEPKAKATEERKPFTHSVFDFDDDDDDFDLDFDYAVKSIQKPKNDSSDTGFQNSSDHESSYEEKSERQTSRRNNSQSNQSHSFDDFNSIDIDDDDDDNFEQTRNRRNRNRRNIEDDEFIEDIAPRRQETKRNRRADRVERNDRRNNSPRKGESSNNPIVETLRQKGYEIISGISIKNTYIDYVAVAKNIIYLCLVDKESGDWLADEERFNDEEPLWFSESNHRISPVRLVDIARNRLAKKLSDSNITYDLRAFVIVQSGNIINAEDMFEVWRGLDVDVTRINRGSPRELPLFSKSIEEIEDRIDSVRFENLKKLIKSID